MKHYVLVIHDQTHGTTEEREFTDLDEAWEERYIAQAKAVKDGLDQQVLLWGELREDPQVHGPGMEDIEGSE